MAINFVKRVVDFLSGKQGEPLGNAPEGVPGNAHDTALDHQQLQGMFKHVFELLEDNFSKEHPDKHYLSAALKLKLPGTEHIDATRQEVVFSTYNTLFARTAADCAQRHGFANISVDTGQDPAKLTLSHFNADIIKNLHSQLSPPSPTQSFVERLEAEQRDTSRSR